MEAEPLGCASLPELKKLRSIVQDCLSKHLYSSAIFFADKLVTLSEGAPGDVYLLAEGYYMNKQYRRVLLLLRGQNLLNANMHFRYLAAKCLAECMEWDECLATLGECGDDDTSEGDSGADGSESISGWRGPFESGGPGVSMEAAACLLRGRVYDALENRARATHWYFLAFARGPQQAPGRFAVPRDSAPPSWILQPIPHVHVACS
ncbi:hypothetical protein CYMTET_33925 [Cymbomonas tetramitiformis]|uniref:Uncharacterized protein n=1 Tax=Cymbomonas tetramitiformis TaxID=36881 RepID=A0AAE0KQD9_9CHLO|nr:hypothetical protein CYMTET_33925 [Cymbomonas tetramitiformis]